MKEDLELCSRIKALLTASPECELVIAAWSCCGPHRLLLAISQQYFPLACRDGCVCSMFSHGEKSFDSVHLGISLSPNLLLLCVRSEESTLT